MNVDAPSAWLQEGLKEWGSAGDWWRALMQGYAEDQSSEEYFDLVAEVMDPDLWRALTPGQQDWLLQNAKVRGLIKKHSPEQYEQDRREEQQAMDEHWDWYYGPDGVITKQDEERRKRKEDWGDVE